MRDYLRSFRFNYFSLSPWQRKPVSTSKRNHKDVWTGQTNAGHAEVISFLFDIYLISSQSISGNVLKSVKSHAHWQPELTIYSAYWSSGIVWERIKLIGQF